MNFIYDGFIVAIKFMLAFLCQKTFSLDSLHAFLPLYNILL